jgi:septal ring factor EnvC (AmiA/AmiB activator)
MVDVPVIPLFTATVAGLTVKNVYAQAVGQTAESGGDMSIASIAQQLGVVGIIIVVASFMLRRSDSRDQAAAAKDDVDRAAERDATQRNYSVLQENYEKERTAHEKTREYWRTVNQDMQAERKELISAHNDERRRLLDTIDSLTKKITTLGD